MRALDLVAVGIFRKEIRRNLDPLKRVSVDEGFGGLPGVMRRIKGHISEEGLFLSMCLGLGEKAKGFIGNDFTPVFAALPESFELRIIGTPGVRPVG